MWRPYTYLELLIDPKNCTLIKNSFFIYELKIHLWYLKNTKSLRLQFSHKYFPFHVFYLVSHFIHKCLHKSSLFFPVKFCCWISLIEGVPAEVTDGLMGAVIYSIGYVKWVKLVFLLFLQKKSITLVFQERKKGVFVFCKVFNVDFFQVLKFLSW